MDEINIIEINTEFIPLAQLLKLADVVSSGGQVKHLIAEEEILYNGEVEYRVRKKVYPGDIVEVYGEKFGVEIAD